MKKYAAILPLVGLLAHYFILCDYVYPVGVYEQEGVTSVLIMYQKSPQHTELWQFEPESGEAQRALLSTFTPLGVALLPDNAGFSFFDNGRLRVKLWHKRSSKAIDIFEPLYDIGPVQWETEHTCYFHAREREFFNVYKLDTFDGSIKKIISNETCDCFYPCIQGQSVWYLQRSPEESRIMIHTNNNDKLLYIHDQPLAFLSCGSGQELVIEHQRKVNLYYDKVLSCTCCRLHGHEEGGCYLERLFSFTIPLMFIVSTSQTHLCESLYPLLPRVIGNAIYFVSTMADDEVTGKLYPYVYTRERGVQPMSIPVNGVLTDFFTPCRVHEKLLYGGTVSKDLRDGPWMDEDQAVFLQLPLVSL
jgi:hypothetical protein